MAECTTLNLVRTKFKVVHSARCQNHLDVLEALYIRTKHANLVSTKRIVHVPYICGKLLRDQVQEKMSDGTV